MVPSHCRIARRYWPVISVRIPQILTTATREVLERLTTLQNHDVKIQHLERQITDRPARLSGLLGDVAAIDADGRLLRLRLARPKANIVDAPIIAALDAAFAGLVDAADVSAVLLDAEGPNFSFGASVEEHLPDNCADMLKGLHGLIRRMLDCPVP